MSPCFDAGVTRANSVFLPKQESEKQVTRQTEAEKQRAAKKVAERKRHKRYAAQKARLEAAEQNATV